MARHGLAHDAEPDESDTLLGHACPVADATLVNATRDRIPATSSGNPMEKRPRTPMTNRPPVAIESRAFRVVGAEAMAATPAQTARPRITAATTGTVRSPGSPGPCERMMAR